jgi:hypothetical protein
MGFVVYLGRVTFFLKNRGPGVQKAHHVLFFSPFFLFANKPSNLRYCRPYRMGPVKKNGMSTFSGTPDWLRSNFPNEIQNTPKKV